MVPGGQMHLMENYTKHGVWITMVGCNKKVIISKKKDTSYSASTRIEKINNDIILFSVIKNANPKIFKAISSSDKKIVFENTDYKNPFRVIYEFIDSATYKRTIEGYENDSLVVYEFNFRKID